VKLPFLLEVTKTIYIYFKHKDPEKNPMSIRAFAKYTVLIVRTTNNLVNITFNMKKKYREASGRYITIMKMIKPA
jgi:hypothetical protein